MRGVIMLIVLAGVCLPLCAEAVFSHTPPTSLRSDRDVSLVLDILTQSDQIDEALIYYRLIGDPVFIKDEMSVPEMGNPIVRWVVPRTLDPTVGIEYYFEIRFKGGSMTTLPQNQPQLNPYRILPNFSETLAGNLVLLSPESMRIKPGEPTIVAVSLFAVRDDISPGSVRILVGKREVTTKATVSNNMLVVEVVPENEGSLDLEVRFTTNDGHQLSREWEFIAVGMGSPRTEEWLRGSVTSNYRYMGLDSDPQGPAEFYDHYADLELLINGKRNWFDWGAKVFLSSEESGTSQSVNRFSITTGIPHWRIVWGDHTPMYDTFTMNNRNLRGVHSELYFKNFRFLLNWGITQKPIDAVYETDSLNTKIFTRGSAFARQTMGVRLEMGERSNQYTSILWGISAVKTKDDEDSIDNEFIYDQDSVAVFTPVDNLVLASDFTITSFKGRLSWGGEFAFSLYNHNIIGGAMSVDELEEYGLDNPVIDPEAWEDLIIINKNMEPYMPGKQNMSWRFWANLHIPYNVLSVSRTNIGPAFRSLSSETGLSDTRRFSVSDQLYLFSGKCVVSGGISLNSNNINNQMEYTSRTTAWYASASIRFPHYPSLYFGLRNNDTEGEDESPQPNTTVAGVHETSSEMYIGAGYDLLEQTIAPSRLSVNWQTTDREDLRSEEYKAMRESMTFSVDTDWRNLPMNSRVSVGLTSDDQENIGAEGESIDWSTLSMSVRNEFRLLGDKLTPYFLVKWNNNDYGDGEVFTHVHVGSGYRLLANTYVHGEAYVTNLGRDDEKGYQSTGGRLYFQQSF